MMKTFMRGTTLFALILVLTLTFSSAWLAAEEEKKETVVTTSEEVQVTATRLPEAVEPEPASVSVISGDRLRQTGATDLGTALALVGGVSIAPGSDSGPASSVPELWGLREMDAFLLVVDGVPWGGAFNPSTATLDLNDIERIEILRGPAPVMYGATSFVGVIHVIHRAASSTGNAARAWVGNYSSGSGGARVVLPSNDTWKHALSANFDAQGFKDDRTNFKRGHFLYRGEAKTDSGQFHIDTDLTFLRQSPASPRPRVGATLTPLVPLDSNQNPADSKQNEDRYHLAGGYDGKVGNNDWAVLAAVTHANRDLTKGFVSEVSNEVDPNTAGYRQTQSETDVYLDTHLSLKPHSTVKVLMGGDYIYGNGNAKAENFDYFINLDGSNPPNSLDQTVQERPQLTDKRNFFGLYGQVEWTPIAELLIQGGLRFNSTHETKTGQVLSGASNPGEEPTTDSLSTNRMSGTIGASYLAWSESNEGLWVFADYRNAFKPAAVDFGPEAEGDLLKPEYAQTYEGGVKGRLFSRRFDWQASIFLMDFSNLVSSAVVDGLPVLINTGKQRYKGFEFESEGEISADLRWQFSYSFHSSKFVDFVQLFDNVPTQLAGNYVEMVPKNLVAGGLAYSPAKGVNGSLVVNYVGQRFLNKRNTAIAEGYTTLSMGIGYRFGHNNIRFDAVNLTDQRPPVSESELGDAQYYILPARSFQIGWQMTF